MGMKLVVGGQNWQRVRKVHTSPPPFGVRQWETWGLRFKVGGRGKMSTRGKNGGLG